MSVDSIIKENKKRLSQLNKPYDPLSGKGSPIERQKVSFSDFGDVYLPVELLNKVDWIDKLCETGNFSDFSTESGIPSGQILKEFFNERFKTDFEFWAFTTIIIQDKLSLKDIPFKLRGAQLILLEVLEDMRMAGIPIRIILLKARQWGGSTLVQMFMMWIQQIHKKNWHLAVCAQDDGAAKNISEMYNRAALHYPDGIGKITFKPYARSPKNLVDTKRGGIIGVGSINNPDQFRSYNYPMNHISESGIWEDTPKRTAKGLVSSLRSSVPNVPYSLIVNESTAKGVGTFFHDEWLAAVNGKSRYRSVFVPWYKIDLYQEKIKDYSVFINTMTEYDKFCWDEGATLEGINWYRNYKEGENYDDNQMNEEYPTTPEEAFISTGSRIFPYQYIKQARINTRPPIAIGDIQPAGLTNKEAFKDIKFHENKNLKYGLKIWKFPEPYVTIKGKRYFVTNRYCGFADIGGIHRDADYSCLKIYDRYWMLFGGNPETAAMWHGHLDQDLVSWKFAQLGYWYQMMLLAIESNSLRKEKTDGDYFITVLDNIAKVYNNLFIRNNHEKIDSDFMPKYGFHTGQGNKDMIITNLLGNFRDDTITEKEKETFDECDTFERKPDGTMGAVQGKKDDRVIVTAGGGWLATKYMKPPTLIDYVAPGDKRKSKTKTIVSEASM